MDELDDIARGQHAENLLNDPLLKEAFGDLEAAYIEAWKGTSARDTDARERLFLAVQIVGKVQAHLRKAADNGKLTKAQADEIARQGERFGG